MHSSHLEAQISQNFPRGACLRTPLANECLSVRPVSPWRSATNDSRCSDWLFGTEHKETVAKDELTQLLKYEKHELYQNPFGSGFVYNDALVYPLSTPRESIPCSVVITMWISEPVNLRIAMRDYSHRSQHKREDVFSSCGERGGVGVIFVLSCFVVGGRIKKPLRALGGCLWNACSVLQNCPPPPPPSQVINDQPLRGKV